MSVQSIELKVVSKEDVARIRDWLEDDEIAEAWLEDTPMVIRLI